MKPDAVLFTSQLSLSGQEQELMGHAACLWPVLGKPLLQRVMERLVGLGCKHISVVLSDAAQEIKAFLAKGERWGCQLSFHYFDPYENIGKLMARLGIQPSGSYWIAEATRLPTLGDQGVLCDVSGWTGWAKLSGNWLLSQYDVPAVLPALLMDDFQLARQCVGTLLQVGDNKHFLESCFSMLNGQSIGQDSHIDSSVTLIEPVYIGANVKIAAGCVIGPFVSIEQDCFIDCNVHMHHSVILPHSYIGQNLYLNQNLIQGSWMANIALGCSYSLNDAQLLSDLRTPILAQERIQIYLAWSLHYLLWPIYKFAINRVPTLEVLPVYVPYPQSLGSRKINIALALSPCASVLQHFCYRFFPGLKAVCRGQLNLLGPDVRTFSAVAQLPSEWQRLYDHHRAGLLNEALFIKNANTDDLFASDLLAAANTHNTFETLNILRRYLGKVLSALFCFTRTHSQSQHKLV